MKKIFLYPKYEQKTDMSYNPYIFDIEASLKENFEIVNNSSSKGVLEFFRYIFIADIFFLNWIENLPVRRYGKIQLVIFIFFTYISKLFGKKIVWTLHNKYSHEKSKNKWTDFILSFIIRHSNIILTHSEVGINYLKDNYPKHARKAKYFIHPIHNLFPISQTNDKKYDFLIWGTIHPYKGITQFLKFVKGSQSFANVKIMIIGYCPDESYRNELQKYLSDNIVHRNEFFEMEEIAQYASQSKFVLFTYKSESVLSSGSLMDSIRMGASIIGPNEGAFKDLNKKSFINTYSDFEDIDKMYKTNCIDYSILMKEIETFYDENNWKNFSKKLNKELLKAL